MARKCRSTTNTFMELPSPLNRGHGHFVYTADDGRRSMGNFAVLDCDHGELRNEGYGCRHRMSALSQCAHCAGRDYLDPVAVFNAIGWPAQ